MPTATGEEERRRGGEEEEETRDEEAREEGVHLGWRRMGAALYARAFDTLCDSTFRSCLSRTTFIFRCQYDSDSSPNGNWKL